MSITSDMVYPPNKNTTKIIGCLTRNEMATAEEISAITSIRYRLVARILRKMVLLKYAFEVDGEWGLTK